MKDSNNQFFDLMIKNGESETLEFKTEEATKNILNIAESVCAFSNTSGGTILIGVSDSKSVLGVKNKDSLIKKLNQLLPTLISPQIQITLNDLTVDDKTILMINVPVGSDLPYTINDKIFVRNHQKTIVAKTNDIRKLINERVLINERWERKILYGKHIEDLDKKTLKKFMNAAEASLYHGTQNIGDTSELILAIGLGENDLIYNSGYVLFGERPERVFPQIRVRIVIYKGLNKDNVVERRVIDGNLFQIIENTMNFLERSIRINSSLSDNSLKRNMTPEYPLIAIREALLNSVVHRDYLAPDGGVSINIFDDRIEFWNSGRLPDGITFQNLKEDHASRPRNPDIAHAFLLNGYIEQVGSGTTRIISQFKNAGLPEPKWSELTGGVLLTFRSKFKAKVNNNTSSSDLNPRQMNLLKTLPINDSISVMEYIKSLKGKVQERQAREDIRHLVAGGFLKRVGASKSSRYLRTNKIK